MSSLALTLARSERAISNLSLYTPAARGTPREPIARAARRRVTASAVALALATLGATAAAHESPGSVQPDGRFTPNVEGAQFPPQPREIDDVRQYRPQPEEGGSLSTLANPALGTVGRIQSFSIEAEAEADDGGDVGKARRAALRAVLEDDDVQRALGERYSVLDSVPVDDEDAREKNRFRVDFFSLDSNATVTVLYANGQVESVSRVAAAEGQPPLGEREMTRAVELAREHWIAEGVTRVDVLTGYAIQTFEEDGTPYENRVAYVSFHTESPEPPEFLTWVDLTAERVLRAEVAQ